MDLRSGPVDRQSCAEPLEARRLLSGSELPPLKVDAADDAVEQPVSIAALPASVISALNNRYPGILLIAADFTVDAGRQIYEVTARTRTGGIEASLSPGGQLLQFESVSLPPVAEPQSLAPTDMGSTIASVPVEAASPETTIPEATTPAIPVSKATQPAPLDKVEVLEVAPADSGDAGDVEISPSRLPKNVAAALQSRFPGAIIRDAVSSVDDLSGETEYDVGVTAGGQAFDVTLLTTGKITEWAQDLSESSLPAPVIDWVRRNYSDGTIGGVAKVNKSGALNYEVQIASPGQPMVEAVLRLADTPKAVGDSAARTGAETILQPLVYGQPINSGQPGSWGDVVVDSSSAEPPILANPTPFAISAVRWSESKLSTGVQSKSAGADGGRGEILPNFRTEAMAGSNPHNEPNASIVESLVQFLHVRHTPLFSIIDGLQLFTAASSGASSLKSFLPEAAGLLGTSMLADLTAAEGRLRALLNDLNAFAEKVPVEGAVQSPALRLALLITFVAGARLVVNDSRARARRGAGTVLNSSLDNDWSWVLGASTVRGRRKP